MTLHAPMRCSALAEELGEPMIGTVDQRIRWLLLEDRSPWGSDAVEDVFGADAADAAKRLRIRLLLVRRREGDPAADAVRRAVLVDTVTREMATRTVREPAELSLESGAHAPVGGFGEMVSERIFLVCTNGKRDACCALRGRALTTALAADHAARLWECTHLGGHRFAANLVCLPDGLVYGRLRPEDGPRLAAAYLDGRLEPPLLRGRSAWPAPAQVAEQTLRLQRGLTAVDDVRLVKAEEDGIEARVTLATKNGRTHGFELRSELAEPPRPISCRADEPESPVHWSMV